MPSPDGKSQEVPSSTLPDLHDRLDSLWISYLRHLDAYTTAQKALQQHMRSGFFSLSRANFSARSGMRYGSDYFHDRAIATRRFTIDQADEREDGGRLKLRILVRSPAQDDGEDGKATEDEAAADLPQQQPSPPTTPRPEDERSGHGIAKDKTKGDDPSTKNSKPKLPLEADPLRWYGILVPRELRLAQASFSTVVDEDLSLAVNAGRAMREVEAEIRKLRKEIRRGERAEKG